MVVVGRGGARSALHAVGRGGARSAVFVLRDSRRGRDVIAGPYRIKDGAAAFAPIRLRPGLL